MRAWFTVTQCPSGLSIHSSCCVRVSDCHFHLPKLSISSRHHKVRVTSENCIRGDSSMFTERSSDSASKKIEISGLSTAWIHFLPIPSGFLSLTYIVSVTVIVRRTRISSLRGGKQKGDRIQHACEFLAPSSPFWNGGTAGLSLSGQDCSRDQGLPLVACHR